MKRVSLFSKEAADKLRKDGFSGSISVRWERGVINDFDFTREPEIPRSPMELEIEP